MTRETYTQSEHERINAREWPGTRQLCSHCGEPTGRCEEDPLIGCDGEPLCEVCYDKESKATRWGETYREALAEMTAERDGLKNNVASTQQMLTQMHEMVADMCGHLGADPANVPCDAWQLRDMILKLEAERDGLRAEVERLRGEHMSENERIMRENERLRGALEMIAKGPEEDTTLEYATSNGNYDDAFYGGFNSASFQCAEIAREALGKEGGNADRD